MKKIITFILVLVSIFSFNRSALAYEAVPNDCLKDNSCLLVCNYMNMFSDDTSKTISIYYHYNGEWQVSSAERELEDYYGKKLYGNMKYIQNKGPHFFDNIFSSNDSPNIYLLNNLSVENFKCPNHAYFDRAMWTEICLSDNPKDCEDKSNLGTDFGEKDSGFVSDVKDYDLEDQIVIYYDRGIMQDLVQDITSGKIDALEAVQEKVYSDVSKTFFNGNKIPAFIENSEVNAIGKAKIEAEYNRYRKQFLDQAAQDLIDGKITQEDYDNVVNNWKYTGEEVATAAIDVIYKNQEFTGDWDGKSCDSILGNIKDSSDPAYYLNFAFNLMKYAAIILLFVLSVVDYFKAVASSDNDALKKATSKTIKRVIICVIIFFLPTLINFLLELLGLVDNPTCGIGG